VTHDSRNAQFRDWPEWHPLYLINPSIILQFL